MNDLTVVVIATSFCLSACIIIWTWIKKQTKELFTTVTLTIGAQASELKSNDLIVFESPGGVRYPARIAKIQGDTVTARVSNKPSNYWLL